MTRTLEGMDDGKSDIVVYNCARDVKIEVLTRDETVWLNRQQLAILFGRDVKTIGKHIANALKEELKGIATVAKFATVHNEGGRTVTRQVEYYDLDMILSVGYRVKSSQGVRFRRWATRVLREMLLNRVEEVREIAKLKHRVDTMEGDIKQIKGGMNYLVQQLSAPPDPPRRRIGFGGDDDTSTKPYGKKG